MKKLVVLLIIMAATTTAIAQNEVDALRFTRYQYGGTARSMGMGGAYGAVGADFSSLSSNPAGMALYKRSEVSFTPTFLSGKVSSTFNGTMSDDSKNSFTIGNIGAVLVMENQDSRSNSDWKNFQFGFGYNRLANYNANYYITGVNAKTSILGQYVNWANGIAPLNLGADGAFDTQLAYADSLLYLKDKIRNIYSADILDQATFPGITETKTVNTTGYLGETVFAGSANYQDRIYFGASLGVVALKYEESATYTETDPNHKVPIFNSLTKFDHQIIKGTGINLKLGVIVRAADWLRLGAAVHTPTLYSKVNIDYYTDMSSTFDNGFTANAKSPLGQYTFDMTTPLKLIGSAAFIIGKSGLISADYEMVDYTKARLSPSSDFTTANQRIQDKYKSTSNIRIGGEYRFGQLSFRGGYGFFGSPYSSEVNNGKANLVSLGIGYRTQDYFVDFAYSNYSMTEDYYLYGVDASNKTSLKTSNNTVMLTCGLKF